MKKFACLVLALAMVFSLSICASAATTDTLQSVPQSSTGDVSVTIAGNEATVYYVEVVWQELAFAYNGTKTWKPTEHSYEVTPQWTTSAITDAIVVKNHSNAAVTVSTNKTVYDTNRSVQFFVTTAGSETLGSAVGTPLATPPSVSYKVEVDTSIAPDNLAEGTFKLGQIEINITAA